MKKTLLIVICACIIISLCFSGCAAESKGEYVNAVPEEEVITEEAVAEESSASGLGDIGDITVSDDKTRHLQYILYLNIDTNEFDEDYSKIIKETQKNGGYVEGEYLSSGNITEFSKTGRHLSITLRIPTDKYSDFASAVFGIGTVTSKETQTQDLSESYYDVDSRIELLEERKERLMGHLDTASEMDDIIMLEDEIAEVIYELESLEKSKRGIEKKTQYATVDISMTEYLKAEDINIKNDKGDAGEAFNMTMKGMGEFFEMFGLGLAAAAPVLILAAVIIAATMFAIKGIKILIRKVKNNKKQP